MDHYIILLLKHLSNHAFHNKRFQTLFIDQFVLSKGQRVPSRPSCVMKHIIIDWHNSVLVYVYSASGNRSLDLLVTQSPSGGYRRPLVTALPFNI